MWIFDLTTLPPPPPTTRLGREPETMFFDTATAQWMGCTMLGGNPWIVRQVQSGEWITVRKASQHERDVIDAALDAKEIA